MPPIHTIKHIIQPTNTAITTGNVRQIAIATTVTIGAARTTTNSVEEGSVIKAVYVEIWIAGTHATDTSQFTMIISKLVKGGSVPTATEMANLSSWDNKANVLYTTQGVIASTGSQALPVHRAWISIPKGKQRMSLGDVLNITIHAVGTLQTCGLIIYKEYY